MHALKLTVIGLVLAMFGIGWPTASSAAVTTYSGDAISLGDGTVNTYVTLLDGGVPIAVGIRITDAAFQGLPEHLNNTTRCFDLNGDGNLEAGTECLGDYETAIVWPPEAGRAKLPFEWMGLTWNPLGHHPEGVYDVPHFDMHFFMVKQEVIASIRSGPCEGLVDCVVLERARVPVPARYLPVGHADVGAVVAEMGNHLVNTMAPELATPAERFTHTLMYGAYDGEVIFIEPMVTREFLLDKPNVCVPIAQPAAWRKPGHYPTRYCIRHQAEEAAVTVSLEGFIDHKTAVQTDPPEFYPDYS